MHILHHDIIKVFRTKKVSLLNRFFLVSVHKFILLFDHNIQILSAICLSPSPSLSEFGLAKNFYLAY